MSRSVSRAVGSSLLALLLAARAEPSRIPTTSPDRPRDKESDALALAEWDHLARVTSNLGAPEHTP